MGNNPAGALDPSGLIDRETLGAIALEGTLGGIQGAANLANGGTDAVVGTLNLPAALYNNTLGWIPGAKPIPYIPSPDWSKDLVVSEDPTDRAISRNAAAIGIAAASFKLPPISLKVPAVSLANPFSRGPSLAIAGGGRLGGANAIAVGSQTITVPARSTSIATTAGQAHTMCSTGGSAPNAKLPRFEGPKPTYTVNSAHVPGTLRKGKTSLPADAEDVFRHAVPDDPVNPRNWYGQNPNGQIYRFSGGHDGTAHFSGIDGVGDGIRNITRYARQRLTELSQ